MAAEAAQETRGMCFAMSFWKIGFKTNDSETGLPKWQRLNSGGHNTYCFRFRRQNQNVTRENSQAKSDRESSENDPEKLAVEFTRSSKSTPLDSWSSKSKTTPLERRRAAYSQIVKAELVTVRTVDSEDFGVSFASLDRAHLNSNSPVASARASPRSKLTSFQHSALETHFPSPSASFSSLGSPRSNVTSFKHPALETLGEYLEAKKHEKKERALRAGSPSANELFRSHSSSFSSRTSARSKAATSRHSSSRASPRSKSASKRQAMQTVAEYLEDKKQARKRAPEAGVAPASCEPSSPQSPIVVSAAGRYHSGPQVILPVFDEQAAWPLAGLRAPEEAKRKADDMSDMQTPEDEKSSVHSIRIQTAGPPADRDDRGSLVAAAEPRAKAALAPPDMPDQPTRSRAPVSAMLPEKTLQMIDYWLRYGSVSGRGGGSQGGLEFRGGYM